MTISSRVLTDNSSVSDSAIATYVYGSILRALNVKHDIDKLDVDHNVSRLNIVTRVVREI